MFSEITDIWFRSVCSLEQIAEALGLSDATYDAEDYWAWMIGTLANVELDVTRTHTCPAELTDTRIFQVDSGTIGKDLIAEIVARLRRVTSEPIMMRPVAVSLREQF
ncbi:MAG TPA: hypothetical protein VN688_11920 [Gemmataceae bacterium]|nr:hypothetical protein [Gemmataceae bacterium]